MIRIDLPSGFKISEESQDFPGRDESEGVVNICLFPVRSSDLVELEGTGLADPQAFPGKTRSEYNGKCELTVVGFAKGSADRLATKGAGKLFPALV